MSDMIGNKNNLFKFQIGNALMPVIIIVAVIVISGITVYFLIFQQHNLKIGALRSTRDNGYFSKIESTKLNLKTSKLATIPTKYEEIGSNTVSSIESIIFNSIGTEVAYIVTQTKHNGADLASLTSHSFVVRNEKEEEVYDGVSDLSFFFSPDNKHLLYTAKKVNKGFLVVDGEEVASYDSIGIPRFNSDGQLMYNAADKGISFIVINEDRKDLPSTSSIPLYSLDGKSMAYELRDGNKESVVFNGVEQKKYDSVNEFSIKFSNDGKRVSYIATNNGESIVVVDGKENEQSARIAGWPVFSPDGTRVAHSAYDGSKYFIALDGIKEEKDYDWEIGVGSIKFSPNGARMAYTVSNSEYYDAKKAKGFAVIDGKEGDTYGLVHNITFSPDSSRVVYIAEKDNKETVIVNEEEQRFYDNITSDIVFSPDSNHIAFKVEEGFIVVDNREGKKYDYVSDPRFSPDGKYVMFGAKDGNELWWVAEEVDSFGSAPTVIDSDNDGLTDVEETLRGSNSNNPDTDGDGFKDGDEVKNGYNPNGNGKL